jgi:hypothetical protein
LLALCSNLQPGGVPILVAFYDFHGLQWDYSFPRSPHGRARRISDNILYEADKTESLEITAVSFVSQYIFHIAVTLGIVELELNRCLRGYTVSFSQWLLESHDESCFRISLLLQVILTYVFVFCFPMRMPAWYLEIGHDHLNPNPKFSHTVDIMYIL